MSALQSKEISRVGPIVQDRHTGDCMIFVREAWAELKDYGHELSRINLGIWEGPRVHEVRFLSSGVVVESLPLRINSAAEFDHLRQFVTNLPAARR